MDSKKSKQARAFMEDLVEFKAFGRLAYAEEFTSEIANKIIEDNSKKNTLGIYLLKALSEEIKMTRKTSNLLGRKAPKTRFSYESIKLLHLFSTHPQILCMVTTEKDSSPSYEMLVMSSSEKVETLKTLILNAKDNGERINLTSLNNSLRTSEAGFAPLSDQTGSQRGSAILASEESRAPGIYDPTFVSPHQNEMRESRISTPTIAEQNRSPLAPGSYEVGNEIPEVRITHESTPPPHNTASSSASPGSKRHDYPFERPISNSVRRSIIDDTGGSPVLRETVGSKESPKIVPERSVRNKDAPQMAKYEMTEGQMARELTTQKSSTLAGISSNSTEQEFMYDKYSPRSQTKDSNNMKKAMERFQKAQYDDDGLPTARHRFYSPLLDKVQSSDAYLPARSSGSKHNFIPAMYSTSEDNRNTLTRPRVFELEGGTERERPVSKKEKEKPKIVDGGIFYRKPEEIPEMIEKTSFVRQQAAVPKSPIITRAASMNNLNEDDQTIYVSKLRSTLRAFSSKKLVGDLDQNLSKNKDSKGARKYSSGNKKDEEKNSFVVQYVPENYGRARSIDRDKSVNLSEGDWNFDFQRISKLPEGSTLLDPNGSVYVFVAHKENDRLIRKLECASSDDESQFNAYSSRGGRSRLEASRT